MQLHERFDSTYELFSRYGRIGHPGMIVQKNYANFQQGKEAYKKLYNSKTANG